MVVAMRPVVVRLPPAVAVPARADATLLVAARPIVAATALAARPARTTRTVVDVNVPSTVIGAGARFLPTATTVIARSLLRLITRTISIPLRLTRCERAKIDQPGLVCVLSVVVLSI